MEINSLYPKFTCKILYNKYSNNQSHGNFSRISYKYKMDELINHDNEVVIIKTHIKSTVRPQLVRRIASGRNLPHSFLNRTPLKFASIIPGCVDYCNIEKYSNTSTQLYSINTQRIFNSKKKTKKILKSLECTSLDYCTTKKYHSKKKWFIKPDRGSMGKGIIITTKPQEYVKSNTVIEESINMRLIRKRRWDLRIYVYHTIDNNGNLKTYLFKDGLVRLCPEEFNINNINKRNMCSNTSLYTKKDLDKNLNYCMTKLPDYDNIFKNIKYLLNKVHNIMKPMIRHKNSFFLESQLLGYDIIISETNKPYIIEINNFPHYITENNSVEIIEMKKKLVEDMYNIIKGHYLKKTYSTDFILVDDEGKSS